MDALSQGQGSQQAQDVDTPARTLDRAGLKARWVLEIERYERKAEQFTKKGKKIVERYTGERKDTETGTIRYNVLWSNLQTLRPALYGKDPTPEVERRFKDKDPVGRTASDVVERCLGYMINKQGFGDTMRQVVMDRLLPGRGVAWVRYLPHMRDAQVAGTQEVRDDGAGLTEDIEPVEEVHFEEVKFDYVHWQDFGHTVARTWQEVDAVWRIAYLDKNEVEKRFPNANDVPLDQDPEGVSKEQEGVDALKKAKVYEIWDKRTGRAIWLHKSVAGVLDVRDDPLHLEGFFPCPQPLQATTATSSFIPTADYTLWADQAAELDRLTQRIALITKAIKIVGVYDASVPALQSLLNGAAENKLVPVDTWAAFAEKGGLAGAVELLPIEQIAQVLLHLYEARDKVKNDLWEISGLNDLLRGASDPSTTATAEKIKAGFSSVRLKDMQRGVQLFARELVRLAGEIICEHFSVETIKQICGIQLLHDADKQLIQKHQTMAQQQAQPGQPPAVPMPPIDPKMLELMQEPSWEDIEKLLRDNAARSFRIDIETDSTIAQDEQQEQQSRLAFAEMVGKMLEAAGDVIEKTPELAPAMAETFMFVLRSFKVGRPTESAFQEAMDKLVEKAAQPQQSKKDPAEIKAASDQQIAQGKAQADAQKAQAQAQADQATETQRIQSEERLAQFQAQMDAQVAQAQQAAQQAQYEAQARLDAQYDAQTAAQNERLEQMRMANEQQNQQAQQTLQLILARLNNEAKIEVAQIAAETTLQAAQVSAAKAAESGSDE
jgi:hypothetical protein